MPWTSSLKKVSLASQQKIRSFFPKPRRQSGPIQVNTSYVFQARLCLIVELFGGIFILFILDHQTKVNIYIPRILTIKMYRQIYKIAPCFKQRWGLSGETLRLWSIAQSVQYKFWNSLKWINETLLLCFNITNLYYDTNIVHKICLYIPKWSSWCYGYCCKNWTR